MKGINCAHFTSKLRQVFARVGRSSRRAFEKTFSFEEFQQFRKKNLVMLNCAPAVPPSKQSYYCEDQTKFIQTPWPEGRITSKTDFILIYVVRRGDLPPVQCLAVIEIEQIGQEGWH